MTESGPPRQLEGKRRISAVKSPAARQKEGSEKRKVRRGARIRQTNDQSKEKFHSPPNSVGTFSMGPIHTPSLVGFCLNIIFCGNDCIGEKLSRGGKKKKTRLEIPFKLLVDSGWLKENQDVQE